MSSRPHIGLKEGDVVILDNHAYPDTTNPLYLSLAGKTCTIIATEFGEKVRVTHDKDIVTVQFEDGKQHSVYAGRLSPVKTTFAVTILF